MNDVDKERIVAEICAEIGVPMIPLGPGSKEQKLVLTEVRDRLKLPLGDGTKPELAEAIVRHAGLGWEPACESTGSTITTIGLERILEAVRRLKGTASAASSGFVGASYKVATGGIEAPPMTILNDWDALDRGTTEHARLQNEVAAYVTALGAEPRSPTPLGPQFDIAWWAGDVLVVCEVKSANEENITQQLRLGLGQLLEYRFRLQRSISNGVRAVLAMTEAPSDGAGICGAAGIVLVTSDDLSRLDVLTG